jgi:TonB family protein
MIRQTRRMRRSLLAFALLAGCAQPWIVAKKMPRFSTAELSWTYADGVVTPTGKLKKPYTIDARSPTSHWLGQAHTVMLGRVGIYEGVVRFCVDPRGRTRSVTMATSTGDGGLDHVLRQTVEGWRFWAASFDGRPIEACTQAKFVVTYE